MASNIPDSTSSFNAVARLHAILRDIKRAQANETFAATVARVMGIPRSDSALLAYAIAELITLVRSAKSAVLQLPEAEHELNLQPLQVVESALNNLNLDGDRSHYLRVIDESVMAMLPFVARNVARIDHETVIPQEEILRLLGTLETIVAEVTSSGLPAGLKSALVYQLEQMRRALLTYRIHGAAGLGAAVSSFYGTLFRHEEAIRQEKTAPTWRRVVDFLADVDTIASMSLRVKSLVASAAIALLGQ